jgi:hypothetical protein
MWGDRAGRPGRIVVAGGLVLAALVGVGVVTADDMPSATDGNIANGEELRSAEDDDDQVYQVNYTFRLANHQPGFTDGAAEHYAVGLTENGTLHRIKLVSDDFGFSNCEPSDASAFGIDRENDDPGTSTDKSLLTAYKSYTSEEDFIDITYYKEEKLAGKPVEGSVYDQIVAAQNDCYDNPSEPGWYRINGTVTGNVAGGTETDYKIRDLSNWVYVCDCTSRAEAEEQLGPPPGQDGSEDTDENGGSATPTPTATATPASRDSDGGSEPTATATATPTRTPTPSPTPSGSDGAGGSGGDTSGGAGASTPTATPTSGSSGGGGGGGGDSGTGGNSGGGSAAGATTATVTASDGGGSGPARMTPTVGTGPGLGALAALSGLLVAALLRLRKD